MLVDSISCSINTTSTLGLLLGSNRAIRGL